MSNCLHIINTMSQEWQERLLERVDLYTGKGVDPKKAQIIAANDMLAEIQTERDDFMAAVREQHPEPAIDPDSLPAFSARDLSAAKEAGFDTETTWYHGTTAKDFKGFKPGKKGVDELGTGIYLTTQPMYAEAWAGRPSDEGRIIPALLKKGDLFELSKIDSRGIQQEQMDRVWLPLAKRLKEQATPLSAEASMTAPGEALWRTWLDTEDKRLAQHLRDSQKHGGLNTWLARAGYIGATHQHSQIPGQAVVFEAKHLRSPWAKFNPKKAESSNLLHSSRTDPMEVSTRTPWAMKFAEDPVQELLLVGLEASRAAPDAFEKNIRLVTQYPNYRSTSSANTTDKQAERFIEHAKSNLLWLYDQVPESVRNRSHLWYDGANRIASELADKHDLSAAQTSGVIAVLSPQKDWFMNMSLAKRVLEIAGDHANRAWTPGMTATARRIFGKPKYAKDLTGIQGKKLSAIPDPVQAAMWVRIYDQTYNGTDFELLSPEGDVSGLVTNLNGRNSKIAWGALDTITKALVIIRNDNLADISSMLGQQHKVRNFYNNILIPGSLNGHVTIDTHAVAAALLRPLSGKAREVMQNFGGKGSASNAAQGTSGTYGLYAEAYQRAAAERGILPREMQSITWEAARGLFTAVFKSQQANLDATQEIWENYKNGRTSLENTRQSILEAAGGIESPAWFVSNTGSSTQAGAGNARVVPGVQLPGGRAGSTGSRRGGGASLAAAGRLSGAVSHSRRTTETPEFKKWFGDSKVVDAQGKPLVVYNGGGFDLVDGRFRTGVSGDPAKAKNHGKFSGGFDSVMGAFFTPLPEMANRYASDEAVARGVSESSNIMKAWLKSGANGDSPRPSAVGAQIRPVYLSITNPKIYQLAQWREMELFAGGPRSKQFRESIEADGHDGIFITNPAGEIMEISAFSPAQAKSAIGNNGNFDGGDADISHSKREFEEKHGDLDDSSYDDRAAFIEEKSVAFGLANGVRVEVQPWAPYGQVTGVEVTDFFADQPGSGGGTKTMSYIAQLGDDLRISVYLHPESARNLEFYARFGFEKDKRNHGMMVRYPVFDEVDYSIRTGTSAWDMSEPSRFDDFVYKAQNKMIDVKRVIESITQTVGKVADDLNVYLQEELFHGRAAKRTADFGQQELQPLMEQIKRDGYTLADVEEYLHARHAREANAVIAGREASMPDGGSGMTNGVATAYLGLLSAEDTRKLDALATQVDAIIGKTRQLYADYGLESQATVDGWGQMFQHYVPLQREDKTGSMGIGQGFSVKGKETKGRTGSTRKVVDIIANIAMQRERLIVRGEKNRVSQALVGLALANPNPDFWTVGAPPTERVYDPKTNTVVDRADPMYKSRENVLVAKVKRANGEVEEVAVNFNEDDPRAVRMAISLKNLDAGNLEGLLGVSAKITRYFSAVNTQYNPIFGVINLIRDVQSAMLNLDTTPLAGKKGRIAKDTISALSGIYQDMRAARQGRQPTSAWAALWDEFQEQGGQTGFRQLFATSQDRADGLQSILTPQGWMDSGMGKLFTANGALKVPLTVAQKGAGALFDWLSDYNEAMENGVRLAAYKAGLDQGMSKMQAASLAKNLTVNFNRKGQVGQQAGAVYAFFNAAMQGSARIGQTLFTMQGGNLKSVRLSSTGKKVVYGGLLLGSMQALALAAAGFDDEDPPEFVRERSLIIPTGGKSYITIPIPQGFNVIPGLGRNLTEFALSGFKAPAKRVVSIMGMFAGNFNPIGNAGMSMQTLAPTALDPLIALTENRDFTGKPIARVSSNKALPGSSQYKDTASTIGKLLSEGINGLTGGNAYVAGVLSPTQDQIDYLIGQVTGGVGRELSKVEQSALGAYRGEEVPLNKIPLLGRFVGNAASQASQGSTFYSNVNKLNELETEIKGLRKDGKNQEANELARSRPDTYLIAQANVAERQLQRLRREKRELVESNAGREVVKAKEEQMTQVMTRLNQAAEKMRATAE